MFRRYCGHTTGIELSPDELGLVRQLDKVALNLHKAKF
jgi:hypothetical protein